MCEEFITLKGKKRVRNYAITQLSNLIAQRILVCSLNGYEWLHLYAHKDVHISLLSARTLIIIPPNAFKSIAIIAAKETTTTSFVTRIATRI